MPDTHGFEVVAEVTVGVLRQILQAAWKSGGDASGEGVIPEYVEIAPGLAFGPYAIADGTVQIPQDQLGLEMDTAINGVDVKLGLIVHVEIDNPPIPSAKFFDLTADVHVHAPVSTVDGTKNVGIVLTGLPAAAITAQITNGDPIGPITAAAITDYVHQRYQANGAAFPHVIDPIPVSFPPFSMKARVELFDDASVAAQSITVEQPDPAHVKVNIPCHIRFYDITGNYFGVKLATPMGIEGTIVLLADYVEVPGQVTARLSTAAISLENVTPAGAVYGSEGPNYTSNKTLLAAGGYDLEKLIKDQFVPAATAQLHNIGDANIFVPTMAQIEDFIAGQIRNELEKRKQFLVWQPEAPDGSDVTINDVSPKALSDAMALGINDLGGADANALTNFIPAGRDFATAVSAQRVNEAIDSARHDQGVADDQLPHRYNDINGHDADLTDLDITLQTGAIHMEGSVTVIDAILDSIDVDADFSADAGMEWQDGEDGGQIIHPFVIGDPDVDLSLLAWIVSFLIGFITVGIVGAIIGVVVTAIAQRIASRVGGAIITDKITGTLKGIGAWPQTLDQIGTVTGRFLNPIDIDGGGVLMSGTLVVTSTRALTLVNPADSHGPYALNGGLPLHLNGGAALAHTDASWIFGDGQTANGRNPVHTYGDSGIYVAKLRVQVNESGGATTRHFAKITVANTPPHVTLGPDLTVAEGEEFELTGSFTDAEWLDIHRAWFDFGDNSRPVTATVTETNTAPAAMGEARAKHAYCDDGVYHVALVVEDDDGGVGRATMRVTVTNVPPSVKTAHGLCVLVGQPVRLEATFTDPGWCDTHTGVWDFGDCCKRDAVIRETHTPPRGKGTAEATHVYEHCGRYAAMVRVTDDDGGTGAAELIVRAVRLENASFEDGFYHLQSRDPAEGEVANEWTPFLTPLPTLDAQAQRQPTDARFSADEFVCRDGQRSQGVALRGAAVAGVTQKICANEGWDYEFTAWFHLPGLATGTARIGIAPMGGAADPLAPEVVWVEAPAGPEWRNLSVRATARAGRIALFLGVGDIHGGTCSIHWDRASLFAIQPFCPKTPPRRKCVDFGDQKAGIRFSGAFSHDGLTFTPLGREVRTATFGEPPDLTKLAFPREGVRVDLPAPSKDVTVTVTNQTEHPLALVALGQESVISEQTESIPRQTREVVVDGSGITALEIRGGGSESALVRVCFRPDSTTDHERTRASAYHERK